MKTDALIDRLAEGVEPAGMQALRRRLLNGLGAGAAAAFVLMLVLLGVRHDLPQAAGTAIYWSKILYPLLFAVIGFAMLLRLARPGADARLPMALEIVPVAAISAFAWMQWASAPEAEHYALLMGRTWLVCPWLIVLLAVPVFAGTFWGLRGFAPTRPGLAGFAAGLFAGAVSASIYALHCNEGGAPFVALWYSLGIVIVGLAGALAGRLLLRW